jgi:hypothetical protein
MHNFEETIKNLTGLPPFHNFHGDYFKGMDDAEKLWSTSEHKITFNDDVIDVSLWLERIQSKWCLCGNSVVFEDPDAFLHFKLSWLL